ncbi:MAG: CoA-binding protein [Proteobacteria bacterium]|nr:CoA-binding protein [Pseudomonadota bacterium]MDA1022574.1 CoA-binding protein [Pseudomonadota bacterium]
MTKAAAEGACERPADKPFIYLERHNHYSDEMLRAILAQVRTIGVVGASSLWQRPSYYAAKYLNHKGYKIIPINPSRVGEEVLGTKVYASLADVPGQIDMVQVFRASADAYAVTQDTIRNMAEKGIKVLWMQVTVRDDAAAEEAEKAGLTVVMDRCPKIEFARLSGELGWSGINSRVITAKSLRPPNA